MKFEKGGNPTPTGSSWRSLSDLGPSTSVRALTAHAEQRHGRAAGDPPRPRPAAAPSLLLAGAAAVPAIDPTGLPAPHGPRSRQRPAAPSDPLQFSPSERAPDSGDYRPAGGGLGAAPRRHRWEGKGDRDSLPHSTRDPSERRDRAKPWRPASQPINSRPVRRPAPEGHVGGGVLFRFPQ